MSRKSRPALIDAEKRIGTVTRVTASEVELNLPRGFAAIGRRGVARGAVGEFVFIDCDLVVVLGRILETQVPERFRSTLEHQFEQEPNVEPVGRVQLLATVQKTTNIVSRGIEVPPRIGDGIFEATSSALAYIIQEALFDDTNDISHKQAPKISLGRISGVGDTKISVPPEKIFGRHCGIFGATGGGKSWTLAKLICEVSENGGKAIVVDPTGEFVGKFSGATEYTFNGEDGDPTSVFFPSHMMTELSLFAFLRPSGQSQGPALREAVRSLKLGRAIFSKRKIDPKSYNDDNPLKTKFGKILIGKDETIIKSGMEISTYRHLEEACSAEVNSELCDFNFESLAKQVENECLYSPRENNPPKFGNKDPKMIGYCNTLILRISSLLNSPELRCIFDTSQMNFCDALDNFINCPNKNIFLISFRKVSFNHNTRELLLNMIGEYLLRKSREGAFKDIPIICFLDEAHQFLNQAVGDENTKIQLEAFGLIAKEGRKYGLTVAIATQRPRDIPPDVLSQLGTLFVHRLTNSHDRDSVERACGEVDRDVAAFIPSLAQGEAIILGPDLPTPLPIKIEPPAPDSRPASHGPDYQSAWSKNIGNLDSTVSTTGSEIS